MPAGDRAWWRWIPRILRRRRVRSLRRRTQVTKMRRRLVCGDVQAVEGLVIHNREDCSKPRRRTLTHGTLPDQEIIHHPTQTQVCTCNVKSILWNYFRLWTSAVNILPKTTKSTKTIRNTVNVVAVRIVPRKSPRIKVCDPRTI